MRPGMGRGFEHGPPPGDMGRGAPWMGKKSVYLCFIPLLSHLSKIKGSVITLRIKIWVSCQLQLSTKVSHRLWSLKSKVPVVCVCFFLF